MSEVKRYSFWPQIVHLPGGGGVRAEVHFKVEEDGLFVAHQDYARLKAEVEAYRSASDEVAAAFLALPTPHNQVARVCEGIESLKAEVERLTAEVSYDNRVQLHVDKLAGEFTQAEVERLKTQVEQLCKAGYALASALILSEIMSEEEKQVRLKAWKAAKEGKQL